MRDAVWRTQRIAERVAEAESAFDVRAYGVEGAEGGELEAGDEVLVFRVVLALRQIGEQALDRRQTQLSGGHLRGGRVVQRFHRVVERADPR